MDKHSVVPAAGDAQEPAFYTMKVAREFGEELARHDLLPGNHAIGKLARQMETSDAARPFYRGPDHWRAA